MGGMGVSPPVMPVAPGTPGGMGGMGGMGGTGGTGGAGGIGGRGGSGGGGGFRIGDRTFNNSVTTIDNSQSTMGRFGNRDKKPERVKPFNQRGYGAAEQLIGNPGNAVRQLKAMNSLMGLG